MQMPTPGWLPHISWNTQKIGLPPERTSASSLFKPCCDRQLNFLFYRNPFCEQYLTQAVSAAIDTAGNNPITVTMSSRIAVNLFARIIFSFVLNFGHKKTRLVGRVFLSRLINHLFPCGRLYSQDTSQFHRHHHIHTAFHTNHKMRSPLFFPRSHRKSKVLLLYHY